MAIWTAETTVKASPERVLTMLTDPLAISEWSPVPFELDRPVNGSLRPGMRLRVGGKLAGRSLTFEVEVLRADREGLRLRANGPARMQVHYQLLPQGRQTTLRAEIVTAATGMRSRLLVAAIDGLLATGVLAHALARLGRRAADPSLN